MNKTLIACLWILLTGCDYYNSTRICNYTDNDIEVVITFDQDELNNSGLYQNSEKDFATYVLKNFHILRSNLEPIVIDNKKFEGKYLIRKDSCGEIEGGNNLRPAFFGIKSITIDHEKGQTILDSKKEIREAFGADREKPEYYFDYEIR